MENFLTFTATGDNIQQTLLKNEWIPQFHIYQIVDSQKDKPWLSLAMFSMEISH